MTNRLIHQKSPYLLQHAENPVDWYPWGAEALERARAEDRPILVSIGYSACHWCHVMAHESFEDGTTAAVMNDLFVNIKVDREERPDVDSIYLEAVQAMTRSGGWPLNVFLTPDGRPFYGGTYFPSEPRHGMPSWTQVLESVARAYRERRQDVLQNAEALTQYVRESQQISSSRDLSPQILTEAYNTAASEFDWREGGFGGAPKFPQPLGLEFLLRMWRTVGDPGALDFVLLSLRKMASGGIFDQLGGGFHRYSVDGSWVVPHFEKMLYDNALLAYVYTLTWQATHDPIYRETVIRTLDYLLRDMRGPKGGFYSAEDADSEGEEGKFYVWTLEQLEAVLGDDARMAALRYGVTSGGNFEGRTILTIAASFDQIASQVGATPGETEGRLDAARKALLLARERRIPPGKDTKILAAWNGLAIRALAEAGRTFGRVEYLEAADRAADFVLTSMRPRGDLVRSFKDGPSEIGGFLEDYAFMVEGLVALYETTFSRRRLDQARELAEEMLRRFSDPISGLLYDAPAGGTLIARPRSIFDNPIPAGSSSAAMGLLKLTALTGEAKYEEAALPALRAAGEIMVRAPLAVAYMLCALDYHLSTPLQIAIVGGPEAEARALVERVFTRYLPQRALAVGETGDTPLLTERVRIGERPTAYVCEHFACDLPVTDPKALESQLDARATLAPGFDTR